MGVYIEHTLLSMMPMWFSKVPKEIVRMVKKVGPEHTILSTDFGQVHHLPPHEGMRMFIRLSPFIVLRVAFIFSPLPLLIPCLFIVRPNSSWPGVKVIPIAFSKGIESRPTAHERRQDIKVVDTRKIYLP